MIPQRLSIKIATALFTTLLVGASTLQAEIPAPEQILPNDTLAMLTVPDWSRACDLQDASPQLQLWNDPAMKPFKDHFLNKWTEEVVEPLENELGLQFEDYKGLLQGQLTFALLKNDWTASSDEEPGFVLLLDTRDRSDQLRTNLAGLQRRWVDTGKSLRTENVRGVDFFVVPRSTNDLPNTLRKFMPGKSDVTELGDDSDDATQGELFIGQSDSLLIIADSATTVQKILNRLTGGSLPPLAEVDAFAADQTRIFREALTYGWINARELTRLLEASLTLSAQNRDENAPDPFAKIQPAKVMSATGLTGLRSSAFAYTETPDGSLVTLFAGVPQSERTGIFKILAGEAKETLPPPFVPADVVEFQRWRLDGQKAYATLEQMLQEISPQALAGWNFALTTADAAGKQQDPDFDLRQQLMGNLGDDLITYQKAPRSNSIEDLQSPPTLFLLGTHNGDQIVRAVKMVMQMMLGGSPTTREFLGTTIHVFELPSEAGTSKINLAVSRGYIAITTDEAILEEFLRSADNPVKPLRQMAGLAESTEVVIGPGTSLLSFENQKESMRVQAELLRYLGTNSTTELQEPMTPITESMGVGMPRNGLTEWFDFTLLPPFEQIEKYFYHTVYGGGGTSEGLTMKVFSPVPPELRGQSEE